MMKLQQLEEDVKGFNTINYPRVTRGKKSYIQTEARCKEEIGRYIALYHSLKAVDQDARLIRDGIDFWLRRYHKYAIEGNIVSHYRQVGVTTQLCDFEHVIPQSIIRDMLIGGVLTVNQAMNPPTCALSKKNHILLRQSGLTKRTPSAWHFFDRYTKIFEADFETFNGQPISNLHDWTLAEHYKFFSVKP